MNAVAQDSTHTLRRVNIRAFKNQNNFTTTLPAQSITRETLQQLNVPTVGDAARFFSGAQVKDYGGIGGLKTISVRGLGSAHTGILYDGVPVMDVQAGQTDLSRFPTTNLQAIYLYHANPPTILLPATAFAGAAVLSINTTAYNPIQATSNRWQIGVKNGSFGYWQAYAGGTIVLPRNNLLQFFIDGVSSKGDYPFVATNGNIVEKKRRNNAAVSSLQGEGNYSKLFKDSAVLQLKAGTYLSKRGLPGALSFFNDRSVQQLYNRDYFAQLRYKRALTTTTDLLLSGKFNHTYIRYRDPDFLNNNGGLDDRYKQQQQFLSAALSQAISSNWSAALATDLMYSTLKANKKNFADPTRWNVLTNIQLAYKDAVWQLNGGLLWSHFADKNRLQTAAPVQNKFTPTIALSRKLHAESALMARAFYKQVFRMPTFDDLYYNFIGYNKLKPELARQYNLGIVYNKQLSHTVQQLNISVDAYINRVNDKIVAVPSQNLFVWTMLNFGKVDIKGIDITTEVNGALTKTLRWNGRLAYTYQQAKDITDPNSPYFKERIPYAPDHSGSGIISFGWQQWNTGYSSVFSGDRYRLGGNNYYNHLPGWITQDAFISRGFTINAVTCNVKAEINNLANRQYNVINYYPMPGRSYKINILVNY